ncbi:hypothetical protein JTE90_016137 [Oedothorax gibbosus]|uniref:Uncharacterized protein n=1 Tax=Oedothorax gibbosus TaxID=931172 RepID=A0AAV6U7I9_9ARAC|nr:hypothetical protein JTE90_016137 [Oedothorax gibbosus]
MIQTSHWSLLAMLRHMVLGQCCQTLQKKVMKSRCLWIQDLASSRKELCTNRQRSSFNYLWSEEISPVPGREKFPNLDRPQASPRNFQTPWPNAIDDVTKNDALEADVTVI